MNFEIKEIAKFINYKDSQKKQILNNQLEILKNEQVKRNNELKDIIIKFLESKNKQKKETLNI